MSAPGGPTGDPKLRDELSRLQRQHALLTAEVERLKDIESGRLRVRVAKLAAGVVILVLLASQVARVVYHWRRLFF